jgi:peroxiredoxin
VKHHSGKWRVRAQALAKKYPVTRFHVAEYQRLQNRLNGVIYGEMCDGFAANDVSFAGDVGEMQEATEMVILVEDTEERLDFRRTQLESGEGHGLAETVCDSEVEVHNFVEAQHGGCRSGIGNREFTASKCSAHRHLWEERVWRETTGFGKMLGGNSNDGKEHTMSLTAGHTAPDFTLKDQNQNEVKLSDFAGKKKVVLVFYPLDWSPVCTNEHACFVNDMKQFETLDAEVLGISVDSVWSHKAYAEKMGIKYSLLADFHPKGATGEKYGVYLGEKGITGRVIFIVDKQGKVAWAKNYDIPVVPDVKEVATALGGVK